MISSYRKIATGVAAVGLSFALAGAAYAQASSSSSTSSQLSTKVRFDRPVEIPGQVLQPDTYTFQQLGGATGSSSQVQVFRGTSTQPIATLQTRPVRRPASVPTDHPVLVFVDESSMMGTMSGTGSTSGTTGSSQMGSSSSSTGATEGVGSAGTGSTTSDTTRSGSSGNSAYGAGSGNTTYSGSTSNSKSGTSSSWSGTGAAGSTATGSQQGQLILKSWFTPDSTFGQEFIYPSNRASLLARGQLTFMEVGADQRLMLINVPGANTTTGTGSAGGGGYTTGTTGGTGSTGSTGSTGGTGSSGSGGH